MKRKIATLLSALMIVSVLAVTSCTISKPQESPKSETVYFLKDGAADCAIVYSRDIIGHYEKATEIFSGMIVDYEADPRPVRYEYTENTQEKEIVIGDTDRQISKDLKAAIADKSKGVDGVWYAYGYKDGKLGFYANSKEAMDLAWTVSSRLLCRKPPLSVRATFGSSAV